MKEEECKTICSLIKNKSDLAWISCDFPHISYETLSSIDSQQNQNRMKSEYKKNINRPFKITLPGMNMEKVSCVYQKVFHIRRLYYYVYF